MLKPGERIDPTLLTAVTELAEQDVRGLLTEAIESGLLVEDQGSIRFRHALTREAIRFKRNCRHSMTVNGRLSTSDGITTSASA